jgi:hypothetical protein
MYFALYVEGQSDPLWPEFDMRSCKYFVQIEAGKPHRLSARDSPRRPANKVLMFALALIPEREYFSIFPGFVQISGKLPVEVPS